MAKKSSRQIENIDEDPDLERVIRFFEVAALELGKIQVQSQGDALLVKKDSKKDPVKSVVTSVDHKCQQVFLEMAIQHGLNKFRIRAEENSGPLEKFSGTSRYALVIDPIDGTSNYGNQKPEFGTAMGLLDLKEFQFVAGLIYVPSMDTMFEAIRGKGAYKVNASTIDSSTFEKPPAKTVLKAMHKPLEKVHLGYLVSQDAEYRMRVDGIESERPKCAVYSTACLVLGKIQAYYCNESKIWDIGPGSLVLQEANGYSSVPRWDMGRKDVGYFIFAVSEKAGKEMEKRLMGTTEISVLMKR